MSEKYVKTTWKNDDTPLNEINLNKIEAGIETNSSDIIAIQEDISSIKVNYTSSQAKTESLIWRLTPK